MIVGPPAKWPAVLALRYRDRQIVDAGDTPSHQAALIEFPVLVAVAAEPVAAVVVPLIGKSDGDAVVAKCPEFLDQPVVEFALPFARQERLDSSPALQEFRAIPPLAVLGVGKRNTRGLAGVLCVFGQPHLLCGGFLGERRQRRAAHG